MRTISIRLFLILALALAVGLATAVSPFASTAPDGLNRVAADKAFADEGRLAPLQEDSPLPGYAVPGVGDERASKGLAGFAGTLAVFALAYGVAALSRRRRSRPVAA
jgi:hypothetical protein